MNSIKPKHYAQDLPDRDRWPNARRALVLADQERLDRDLARPVTAEEIRQATEWVLRPLTQFDDEPTQPGLGRPWERPL